MLLHLSSNSWNRSCLHHTLVCIVPLLFTVVTQLVTTITTKSYPLVYLLRRSSSFLLTKWCVVRHHAIVPSSSFENTPLTNHRFFCVFRVKKYTVTQLSLLFRYLPWISCPLSTMPLLSGQLIFVDIFFNTSGICMYTFQMFKRLQPKKYTC